jgi:hypothetical protein
LPDKPVELHMARRRGNANSAQTPIRELCSEIAAKAG